MYVCIHTHKTCYFTSNMHHGVVHNWVQGQLYPLAFIENDKTNATLFTDYHPHSIINTLISPYLVTFSTNQYATTVKVQSHDDAISGSKNWWPVINDWSYIYFFKYSLAWTMPCIFKLLVSARPSSDLCNVKNLSKNHTQTLYGYVG
jgi:hypothetical protein